MILERLSLFNFGPYKGHHFIEFPAPNNKKPILLIGGLNGDGKTTLLEAVQLALYGRQSRHRSSGRESYFSYLAGAIHRRVPKTEGAQLELTFLSDLDSHSHDYRIQRSWAQKGKKIQEHVQVFIDGQLDATISERWAEEVHRHLPPQLAALFFFDGEKIEQLADPARSQEVLDEALNGFLGLELLEHLDNDLATIGRRSVKKNNDQGGSEQTLGQALAEVDALVQERTRTVERLKDERKFQKEELATAEHELSKLDSLFSKRGGDLYVSRTEIEARRIAQNSELTALESRMREIAAGCLPLAFAQPLLRETRDRFKREQSAKQARALLEPLTKLRDRAHVVADRARDSAAARKILEIINDDITARRIESDCSIALDLDAASGAQLEALLTGQLAKAQKAARDLVEQHAKIEGLLTETEKLLSQIPDHDEISDLLQNRATASAKADQLRKELSNVADSIRVGEFHQKDAEKKQEALRRKRGQGILGCNRSERLKRNADRARETISEFRTALISRQTNRLEGLILEGYNQLLRKKSLVKRISIDPISRKLTLHTDCSLEIPSSDLSAAERQLLAVSILWALARAVGRPLPIIIDTPLGRLDGSHRGNLVDQYFPFASHQVTLLSTDTEIDKGLYHSLKDRISNSYRISCDEATDTSSISDGYFWS